MKINLTAKNQLIINALRDSRYLLIVFAILISWQTSYGQTWDSVGNTGFSESSVFSTSIALSPSGTPYVAYTDASVPSLGATVMKYNGSSWDTVGTRGFSARVAYCTSMAIDGSGTPYVAYEDLSGDSLNGPATVMKFNGTNWVNVGNADFSAGWVSETSLALNGSGAPYVAYQDLAHGYAASVVEYNGTNWETVGTAGFSAGGVSGYHWLAIDASGTPYVAYSALSTTTLNSDGPVTVMKYNGTSWVNVGSAGFSAGVAYYTSIAIDGSGTPYVVYEDAANGYKATVMKYNGSSWVNVGSPGFSAGEAYFTSIAINGSGTLYVSYEDSSLDKAVVMEFNGTDWVDVGTPGFSHGGVAFPSLAINGSGTVYVAYSDTLTSGVYGRATVMEYGSVTGVANISGKTTGLTVFPDPNKGSFTVNVSTSPGFSKGEECTVVITNMIGENVQELTAMTNTDTPVQLNVPPGIYFISAATKEGKVSGKVVVW